MDASGAVIGYVVTTTSKEGYNGEVTVSVGITSDGEIKGIEFLNYKNESPGLGQNAAKPEWKGQFADKKVEKFSVTKSGAASDDEINAISGATITSNAVTNAVNTALYFVNDCVAQ